MENWMLCNRTADFLLIEKSFGVSSITSRLLANRGQDTVGRIEKYLYPSARDFGDARLLKGVNEACRVLSEKLAGHRKIRIIGDYDVDGVVSAYVLCDVLERLGADVDCRIPERIRDGYGINLSLIDEAHKDGIDTIITCDNGIAAFEQAEYAAGLHMTMIITDHHDIPEKLPRAAAVIDPKQEECGYPEKGICGAVVAAKFMEVFVSEYCSEEQKTKVLTEKPTIMEQYLIYLAIATVCDVCVLSGENRVIVKLGIEELRRTCDCGISALLEECGIDRETLSAYHLGYIIGPCFNATGRLSVADKALALMRAGTREEACRCAAECRRLNEERKAMTKEWLGRALSACEALHLPEYMVIVVYLEGCHESLTGIIAGRLREKYGKPAIVLTDGTNEVKGSGRSVEGYNMFAEISRCGELLIKYGGHPMAAGMSLKRENINAFREALNRNCTLTEDEIAPKVLIDAVVPFGLINEEVIAELSMLEPYGNGNAKPLFAERGLLVLQAYSIGRTTRYFRFRLRNQYGREFTALYFGDFDGLEQRIADKYGASAVRDMFAGRRAEVVMTAAYYPQINEYMGNRSIQMVIQNIKL